MSFFRFYWLRRFIRRNTTPIPYRKAHKYRERFSVIYAVCSLNMLAYIVYEYSQGRLTKENYGLKSKELDMLTPAQQFAVKAGIEKAKILRSGNMNRVEEFRLEDFAHIVEEQNAKPVENDVEDEDNVA